MSNETPKIAFVFASIIDEAIVFAMYDEHRRELMELTARSALSLRIVAQQVESLIKECGNGAVEYNVSSKLDFAEEYLSDQELVDACYDIFGVEAAEHPDEVDIIRENPRTMVVEWTDKQHSDNVAMVTRLRNEA